MYLWYFDAKIFLVLFSYSLPHNRKKIVGTTNNDLKPEVRESLFSVNVSNIETYKNYQENKVSFQGVPS